jgi:hypothetical protein
MKDYILKPYRFSFTAGALMRKEMVLAAKELIKQDFELKQLSPNVLNKDRSKTNKREFAEVALRLKTLDDKEVEFLAEGSLSLSKQVALLACIRAYEFIKDFFAHVILEKVNLYDFSLTERDYISFIRSREMDHPELESLADSTKYKVKQVLFRILDQAELIDSIKSKHINPNFLEPRLGAWLTEQGKLNEVKLLLG